jgi:hypothetical protein
MARAFASQGSIDLLSVLYFRHGVDIGLDFIDTLPLSLDLIEYQHLLPVVALPEDKSILFNCEGNDGDLRPMDSFLLFIRDLFGIVASISDEDRVMILTDTAISREGRHHEKNSLEKIYIERARAIDSSCGSLNLTIEFCESALRALRHSLTTESTVSSSLQTIRSNALVLVDVMMGSMSSDLTNFFALTATGLADEDPNELLYLMLDANLPKDILFRIVNDNLRQRLSNSKDDIDIAFGTSLTRTCCKLVKSSVRPQGFANALFSIRTVCQLSSTSLPTFSRLVQDSSAVLDLILDVIGEMTRFVWEVPSDMLPKIVEILWGAYECLPCPLENDDSYSDPFDHPKADFLKSLLILGDVVSKWPGCDLLSMWRLGIVSSKQAIENELRDEIICQLCRAYLRQDDEGTLCELGEVLVTDIREIISISDSAGGSSLLARELFSPLLQRMKVPILRHLLMVFGSDLFDKEVSQSALVDFTNDAVFNSEGQQNVEAAIACEDSLGEFYPQLRSHFQSIRKYLDVAHFVNSVLFQSTNEYIKPITVKESKAIDVIQLVLAKNPSAVVKDCGEWTDEEYSAKANRRNRQPISEGPIPKLPGIAIYHLAELLGLVDSQSVPLVKSFVIEKCVELGHFGAAAAVCKTLILDMHDEALSLTSLIVHATGSVVKQSAFADRDTKIELCLEMLTRLPAVDSNLEKTNGSTLAGIDAIVFHLSNLLVISSTTIGPFNALSMIHPAALRNIESQLQTLSKSFISGDSDTSLLGEIARSTLNAFVAVVLSPVATLSTYQRDGLLTVLDLGLAILCQSSDLESSRQCLDSIEAVLQSSSESIIDDKSTVNMKNVDEDVLKKLKAIGYSEMGARRAVAMSGNRGFDEALRWAISNSAEPGFDDTIVLVKNGKPRCDTILFHTALSKISRTKEVIEGNKNRELLFHQNPSLPHSLKGVSHYDVTIPTFRSEENKSDAEDIRPSIATTSKEKDHGSTQSNPRLLSGERLVRNGTPSRSSPSSDEAAPRKLIIPTSTVQSSRTTNISHDESPGYTQSAISQPKPSVQRLNDKGVGSKSSTLSTSAMPVPRQSKKMQSNIRHSTDSQVTIDAEQQDLHTKDNSHGQPTATKKGPIESASSRSATRMLGLEFMKTARATQSKETGRSAVENRDALRQLGREALKASRAVLTPSGSSENDRRRLIEEGKRIFQLSRPNPMKSMAPRFSAKANLPAAPNTRDSTLHSNTTSVRPLSGFGQGQQIRAQVQAEKGIPETNSNVQSSLTTPISLVASTSPALPPEANGWEFDDDLANTADSTQPDTKVVESETSNQLGSDAVEMEEDDGWDFDDNF